MKSYSSIQTTVPRTDGTGMDKSRSHELHHISKNVVCKHIFNVVQLSVVSYVYIYIYLCVYPELIKYIVYTSSKIVYCLIIKSVLIQTYRQYSPSISSIIYIYIDTYIISTHCFDTEKVPHWLFHLLTNNQFFSATSVFPLVWANYKQSETKSFGDSHPYLPLFPMRS